MSQGGQTTPAGVIHQMMEDHFQNRSFRGVVTGTSGNRVFVQRNGQGGPDQSAYPRLSSYSAPAVGDEVFCVTLGQTPIVIGKILR